MGNSMTNRECYGAHNYRLVVISFFVYQILFNFCSGQGNFDIANPVQFVTIGVDSTEKLVWNSPKRIAIESHYTDTINYLTSNSRIVQYFKDGHKYKAQLIDNNDNVLRQSLFDKIGVLQDVQYDSNGLVLHLSQFYRDSLELFFDSPALNPAFGLTTHTADALRSQTHWDSAGNISSVTLALGNGKYRLLDFHPNGILAGEWDIADTTTSYKRFHPDGQLSISGYLIYFPNARVSDWKEWYPNGVIKREYSFHPEVPNQREGVWKWYNQKGQLTNVEIYEAGSLIPKLSESKN